MLAALVDDADERARPLLRRPAMPAFGRVDVKFLRVLLDARRREDAARCPRRCPTVMSPIVRKRLGDGLEHADVAERRSSGATPRKPCAVAAACGVTSSVDALAVAHDGERGRLAAVRLDRVLELRPSRRSACRRSRRSGRRRCRPASAAALRRRRPGDAWCSDPRRRGPGPRSRRRRARTRAATFTVTPARTTTSRLPVEPRRYVRGSSSGSTSSRLRHADDAHVAAERDRLDAVLGLAPAERPERGPKPTKNSVTFIPDRLRGDEVAGLVQHDHERRAPTMIASATAAGDDDRAGAEQPSDDREQRSRLAPRGRRSTWTFFERIFHASRACSDGGSTTARARSRATRSASRTSATSSDVPGPAVRALRSTISAIAEPGDPPARNASTATSLAPLRASPGAPPPGPPGLVGERQAGEGLEVGGLERERAERRPVDRAERLGRAGRARRARARSGAACRASTAARSSRRRRTRPCRARPTAGARRRRSGRSRRRTARAPRSPRGPCS